MKNASGLKVQQLDIQQQALKLTANRFIFIFLASRIWFFFSINVTAVHYIIPTFFFLIHSDMAGHAVCMDALGFPIQDSMQSHLQN